MNEESAENRQFAIQRIYVKDASFEIPEAPGVFTLAWEPKIEFGLGTQATRVQETYYEVVLNVNVSAKIDDKIAYLVELQQAGLFLVGGFEDADLGPLLGSFCPGVLYPYASAMVADLVSRSGFPQLLLAPINFDALYQEHLQRTVAGDTAMSGLELLN